MRGFRFDVVRRFMPRAAPVWGVALLLALTPPAAAQQADIRIVSDDAGHRLEVDGETVMVKGVNWDYFPIGTTTTYNFWAQPASFIQQALDREMSLLRAMGGNAIRVYNGIPARWIEYIYDTYGIWSIVNHPVGRYGVTLGGTYIPATDYSDETQRQLIIDEVVAMVEAQEGTRGLLMWLLGNENNYGLEWSSAETEDLPEGEQFAVKARYLYSLVGEVTAAIKAIDTTRPVAIANGDLQYLDIIAEEAGNLDVFGSNVYRGESFLDFFQRVEDEMGIPVMFTEFGADAFNARTLEEDQVTQARYLVEQWREIFEQSAGKGLVGNSIGGLTFQWTDGWWKFGQTDRLDIQDTNASWANDAYPEDFVEGDNNMNEEWWGIVAKGPTDAQGFYGLFPRAAYYALQEAYRLDPYGPGVDLAAIRAHFGSIRPIAAELMARADRAALLGQRTSMARFTGLRMEFETYSTGGESISTPEAAGRPTDQRPGFQGFDTKQSFYASFQANPASNIQADLTLNVLGAVPDNPIDEIFYENVGRTRRIEANGGNYDVSDFERLRVYQADVSWDDRLFSLDAFYRTGHYHWAYDGDFFNLYREANYGPNIDIYNGIAPVGVEFTGKRQFNGLSVAFGPELWWGANPAVMAKYTRPIAGWTVTGVFQEDITRQNNIASSFAVPQPENRKATLHMARTWRGVDIDLGGIWAGSKLVGRTFQIADGEPGDYTLLEDEIKDGDTFGAKAKLTVQRGAWNWYAIGSAMGLVADGGYDQTQIFTGYTLKDTGSGNQWQILSGLAYNTGNWSIAPNFMWNKPIVGPVPPRCVAGDTDQWGGRECIPGTTPARPRNILDDPFAVRLNRETTAGELVLTYDPTPATWMYTWDSDVQEDAEFAVSAGFTFRRHHTTADAAVGIGGDGRTAFAFPAGTPARDLWEARVRMVSKQPAGGPGVIANVYFGTSEPNGADLVPGTDERRALGSEIDRFGADLRFLAGRFKASAFAKFNDWGPYDYHRDFNLTFPMQLVGDVSWTLGLPDWLDDRSNTRFGIRGSYRTLDRYSPRYCPGFSPGPTGSPVCDPTAAGDDGREWEIRTYLHIGM